MRQPGAGRGYTRKGQSARAVELLDRSARLLTRASIRRIIIAQAVRCDGDWGRVSCGGALSLSDARASHLGHDTLKDARKRRRRPLNEVRQKEK